MKSILQLAQTKIVRNVILSASEDLKCVNLFCEKVGGPCICRIERVLAREDLKSSVEILDLSVNKLTQLPPSLYKLNAMKTLTLRDNDLENLDFNDFSSLTNLESIDLTNNPLKDKTNIIDEFKRILPNTKIIFDTTS